MDMCSYEHMDIHERLRQSEQSRRLAWQVLQEIRHVLEILGDQRIPYEGERKRFRAEGDFLVRALVDLISRCRAHLGRLEGEFAELERLVGERDLPRDVLQAVRIFLTHGSVCWFLILLRPHFTIRRKRKKLSTVLKT